LDYEETFSPVVKFDSIKVVLSIAAVEDLEMTQFDVTIAFLHGEILEDIYMSPPVEFEDRCASDMACKLVEALYGLKESNKM